MRKSEFAVNRCKTTSTVQKLLGGKYKIELLWYIASVMSGGLDNCAARLEK